MWKIPLLNEGVQDETQRPLFFILVNGKLQKINEYKAKSIDTWQESMKESGFLGIIRTMYQGIEKIIESCGLIWYLGQLVCFGVPPH